MEHCIAVFDSFSKSLFVIKVTNDRSDAVKMRERPELLLGSYQASDHVTLQGETLTQPLTDKSVGACYETIHREAYSL
jgi:hypothetical protein